MSNDSVHLWTLHGGARIRPSVTMLNEELCVCAGGGGRGAGGIYTVCVYIPERTESVMAATASVNHHGYRWTSIFGILLCSCLSLWKILNEEILL